MDHFMLAECDVTITSYSGFSRFVVMRNYYCPPIFVDEKRWPENTCPTDLPIPRPKKTYFGL